MSKALITPVKESSQELRKLLKTTIPFLQPRILLLLAIKRHENNPVSKRALMQETGLCSYSVHKWRSIYAAGGINALISHNKKGFKPSILNPEQHSSIAAKLHDPENGIRGYKELQQWVLEEFELQISYNTLFKYCTKNFGSKVKVARKYHAKKDDALVSDFKKTSLKSVKKP